MTASLFALMARNFPADRSRPLLITPDGQTLSYGDMDALSARIARLLTELGLAKGDRVAVQVEKSPEALALYLACLKAGLVFLPMNTAYRSDEVDYLLGDAEPGLFVCRPEQQAEAEKLAAARGCPRVMTLGAPLGTNGSGSLAEAAASQPAEFAPLPLAEDDLAAMLYTSGTTGRPKGAMLTHRNLAANGLALRDSWRFTENDVLLHALPIFHAHGLFVACHCVLLAGAAMIWLPRFDAAQVIENLPRATTFMGVPTFYTRLLAEPAFNRDTTAHMRLFTAGSAPMLAATHEAFTERTGHKVLERYGMTETGMNTGNPYDGERIPGTVGLPFPGVSVRVVDDADSPLPTGSAGNIQVKGDNVMLGYWRMPEKTAEEFTADGWFRTGDIGLIDAKGYLSIVGRAKDMIISGGYNVYPKEIEGLIDALPEVKESAVVGVPHPDFGEVGIAIVVPADNQTPDGDTIINHLKNTLANYKVPKKVFTTDTLPRNTMGKVQKNLLRDQHRSLFT
ncbi:malonate--CoA ligase [Roseospirillum parvum]|uniref:Malonyl-CoA/methylmalonyl-CoA synthetase n=1 Tax=Roseospirillum parvum TaxID=83401 RepID=A0A1G7U7V8_9PROT|nr:malonyl-CoA synthase [Roseospirillum parvum]SDG43676.1 malonyl-CoA/methylmalonyl-CoA synthetase [Roseospirillum parvum]